MAQTRRTAVIFGGSGAVGGAVAHALARHGCHVHVGARTRERLDRVVDAVRTAGGTADAFVVDVLDERGTMDRVSQLAERTGGFDVVVNATSFLHDQGTAIDALSLAAFMSPIETFLAAQFNIARAVTPHMGGDRAGVIVTVTAPAGPMAMPGHLGHIVSCAGMEAFTRALASELGPRNVRVLCVRSHAIADAVQAGSYVRELFAPKAQALGLTVEQWVGGAAAGTMLNRLPTLSDVAETIAFLASDHATAMTATVVNVTAGLTTA